jgi:tetratricopeptide (TPR) repeat protein
VRLCREASAPLAPADIALHGRLRAAESQAHLALADYAEAARTATEALALADRLAGQDERVAEIRAWAHQVLGRIMRNRQDLAAALDHTRRAIRAAETAHMPGLMWRCRMEEANLLFVQGQLGEVLARCSALIAQLSVSGDSFTIAQAHGRMAVSHLLRGDVAAGLAAATQAYALRAELGDRHGLVLAANQLALLLITAGRLDEARALVDRTLAEHKATGDQYELGLTLDKLAMIQMLEEDGGGAQATLRRALELPAVAADAALRGDLAHDLAVALLSTGQVDAARQVIPAHPVAGSPWIALDHQLVEGLLALAAGDRAAARVAFEQVAEQAQAAGLLLYRAKSAQLAAAIELPPTPAGWPRLLWVMRDR